ncbi:hypothetical protein G4B88_007065 [Cannabis sativa]|uniref:Uncharacterized protein n=1 Tax=Cannabis sativa TaxID=3483 RepID=A0A7J6GPE1_CANSA|nr:hypothetical protein G4B88_007065 [Cannabis sativa]
MLSSKIIKGNRRTIVTFFATIIVKLKGRKKLKPPRMRIDSPPVPTQVILTSSPFLISRGEEEDDDEEFEGKRRRRMSKPSIRPRPARLVNFAIGKLKFYTDDNHLDVVAQQNISLGKKDNAEDAITKRGHKRNLMWLVEKPYIQIFNRNSIQDVIIRILRFCSCGVGPQRSCGRTLGVRARNILLVVHARLLLRGRRQMFCGNLGSPG